MESPLLADVLRARAEQNRRNIGVFLNPPQGETTLRAPVWADTANSMLTGLFGIDYTNPAPTAPMMGVGSELVPGLAQLVGPASYAIRRGSPKLGAYLAKRPETFYTHFTDEMPAAVEQELRTVGFAKPMDARRAKDLSVIHEFLAGLGQIPTVQNVRSGALARGTARSPYQPLPRPLQAGDVELSLSKDFDPNVFRGLSGKSKATLKQQGETATHEGMHGAWLGKTKGQSGNPPLSPEQASKVMQWIHESGVDPLDVLIKMNAGTFDITHLFLEASAKRASKHVRTSR